MECLLNISSIMYFVFIYYFSVEFYDGLTICWK